VNSEQSATKLTVVVRHTPASAKDGIAIDSLRCPVTDVELVQAAQENDAEAWKVLYQRYLPSVWRYAYALVGDVHVTEDVVGETMLALLKGIGGLDVEVPKISAWLRSVVRHKVADHHRQSCRSEERVKRMLENKETKDIAEVSPTKPLEVAETRNQVLEVLDALSDRQQVALEWKYVEDLRVKEIAERLGETEKAVEATLYRARREFRRRFGLFDIQMPGVSNQKLPDPQIRDSQVGLDSPSL
jgi:RNA polymerase sigma-70 factor (ECF subfamily)